MIHQVIFSTMHQILQVNIFSFKDNEWIKLFSIIYKKTEHRMNFRVFQFSDLGASTQLGCTAVTSNFNDKITTSPLQTLCQFRLSFSIVLKNLCNTVLFKETSRCTLNYNVLKSIWLRNGHCPVQEKRRSRRLMNTSVAW